MHRGVSEEEVAGSALALIVAHMIMLRCVHKQTYDWLIIFRAVLNSSCVSYLKKIYGDTCFDFQLAILKRWG